MKKELIDELLAGQTKYQKFKGMNSFMLDMYQLQDKLKASVGRNLEAFADLGGIYVATYEDQRRLLCFAISWEFQASLEKTGGGAHVEISREFRAPRVKTGGGVCIVITPYMTKAEKSNAAEVWADLSSVFRDHIWKKVARTYKAVIEGDVLDAQTCSISQAKCYKGKACGDIPRHERAEIYLFLFLVVEIVVLSSAVILFYICVNHRRRTEAILVRRKAMSKG
ncbi:izumo sperm-egg fusion protein 3 [Ambystoma mexicanum]|uniref:izumo sperm-egg fusion protein 3 n=1 Tax=Ambystoma mexicanum TaxID=8296 RepID=UPI0037E76FA5